MMDHLMADPIPYGMKPEWLEAQLDSITYMAFGNILRNLLHLDRNN